MSSNGLDKIRAGISKLSDQQFLRTYEALTTDLIPLQLVTDAQEEIVGVFKTEAERRGLELPKGEQ